MMRTTRWIFVCVLIALMAAPTVFATHGNLQNTATNFETWRRSVDINNNYPGWHTALNNGALVWDNVPNQCHDFRRVTSGGKTLVYRVANFDNAGTTFARVWGSHTGMWFDGAEPWHLNVNTSPGGGSLDLFSIAAHEFGHVLSHAHTQQFGINSAWPTLANNFGNGLTYWRTLETHDRQTEQALYPTPCGVDPFWLTSGV